MKDARQAEMWFREGALATSAGRNAAMLVGIFGLVQCLACESPRADDPSQDRISAPPHFDALSRLTPTFPEIVAPGPLMLQANQTKMVMKKAIAVGEGWTLHVIASESENLECEGDHYPPKSAWLEFRYDSGPLGDFYANEPTPVTVNYSFPNDTIDWREAHPNWAHAEITSLTSDSPSVKVEFKRNVGNPDPRVPTSMTASGSMELTVCKSALDLLATTHPVVVDHTPAVATFGDVSFPIRSALVFTSEDSKNGLQVDNLGLYEAERVSCDAAKRAISEHGGGVDGRQIMTGYLPLGAARKGVSVPSPVTFDAGDATTGESWFEMRSFNKKLLGGFIELTDADLSDEPLPGMPWSTPPPTPKASGIRGTIFSDSAEGHVSGWFEAAICKR